MLACAAHPAASAGWRCSRCESLLCPECAGFSEAGQGRLELCLRCGALASPLRERRAVLHPFGPASLAAAVRWPFTKESAISAFACAAVLWLFGKGGALGALVADGLVVSFLFRVTVTTARGERELRGADDFRGFFEDVLGPLVRALVASLWAVGPLIAWVAISGGGFFAGGDPLHPREVTSVVPVLLVLGGALLFPMALLAGALEAPILQLLNPLVVIGYAVKLGRDYVLLAAFCLGTSLAESLLLRALGFIDAHVVGLPDVLQDTALLYPPLMMFRALGLLVRARGDELGYGGEEAYLEPVLGSEGPRTRVQAKDRDALLVAGLSAEREAAAAEDARGFEAGAAHGATRGFEVAPAHGAARGERLPPLDPVPALAPELLPPETGPLAAPLELARKITARDLPGAVEVFAGAGQSIAPATLSAQAWLALAAGCAGQQRGPLALLALRRAVEVAPEGPLAPQAWLQAARVSDELLSDGARSDQLLGELVRRHPGSAEARFAAQRLSARRGNDR